MLNKISFIELSAREKAQQLLDIGTFRELLSPFEHIYSPWLESQGIVPEMDDGVVIAKGLLAGKTTVIVVIEGKFQGGSLGEVSGAKIAAALELAINDQQHSKKIQVILVLDIGGVRLQEANLGLAAIADIHSALVRLRCLTPVIGLITGKIGCFGGLSIAAGLCSYLIMTKEGRLGLNGPEVIEQETDITEFNSHDRPFVWSLIGGEIRYRTGFADIEVPDDIESIRKQVLACLHRGIVKEYRTDQVDDYLSKLKSVDTSKQVDLQQVLQLFAREVSDE